MSLSLSISLLLLSSIFLLSAADEDESFWLTMELSLINLTTSCLSLGGCGRPRLKLVASRGGDLNSAADDEQRSLSWPAVDLLRDAGRTTSFIIHWPTGRPSDVAVICEIAGVDPTYGFPRVCDSSAVEMPFKFNDTDEAHQLTDGKTVALAVRGRCFNATLSVTPHLSRCPWCPSPLLAVIDEDISLGHNDSAYFDASSQLLRPLAPVWLVALLAVVALFASSAFIVTLTAFVRERRRQQKWCGGSRSSSKAKRSTSNHDRVHAHVLRSDSGESKYDTPWDQKFRPLPYWLRGEMSSLAVGAADGVNTVASLRHSCTPSPRATSIIGDLSPQLRTADDSGLESV